MTLLPPAGGPEIVRSRGGEVDALLVVMPESAGPASLAKLPESMRWRDLLARERPRAGAVRTTSLANRRQTLAVLGFLGPKASAFERLALAGRMMKEAAARGPRDDRHSLPRIPGGGRRRGRRPGIARGAARRCSGAGIRAAELPRVRGGGAAYHAHQLPPDAQLDTRYAAISAAGTNLARWLTALPPNILDSRGYRTAVTQLARRNGLEMTWLGEQALRRAGANAFLAVAAGNAAPVAGIAHLRYRPGRRRGGAPDLALIGKGILFDTGGVNLKPHRSMLDMHTDMGGSAVALATLIALAQLRAPIAADAWLAITENTSGRRPTGRRKSCAPPTASPSR